jgi:nucleotide-binding universal stress UspA family protein
MKTILVPVERNDLMESSLAAACLLARMFDGYVEGFALTQQLNVLAAADAVGQVVLYPADFAHEDQTGEESRALFETAMAKHAIARDGPSGEAPSFRWNERSESGGDGFLAGYSRTFDITVVGRPGPTPTSPRMSTLEAALFESGHPILIAPPVAPERLGETVTIAWNGSTESARAIALCLPVLRRARRVMVLTVEGAGVPGPGGEEVALYLRRNGVTCEAATVERGDRSPGKAILEEAAKIDSDLIVKGAFTQSRLRQMIFGGSTRYIIAETPLPVLMAH